MVVVVEVVVVDVVLEVVVVDVDVVVVLVGGDVIGHVACRVTVTLF